MICTCRFSAPSWTVIYILSPTKECIRDLVFVLLPMEDQSPFVDRPEWADVVPLEQYEGAAPIAPILYTPECASVR